MSRFRRTSAWPPVAPAGEELSLFAIGTALLARWRLLVGLPVVAALAALGISLFLPRTYTAQVVFVPEATGQRLSLASDLSGARPGLGAPLGLEARIGGGASIGGGATIGGGVPIGGGSPIRVGAPTGLPAADGAAFYTELVRSRAVLDEVLRSRFPDPRAPAPAPPAALLDILGLEGTLEERLAQGRLWLEDAAGLLFDGRTGWVTLNVGAGHPELAANIANRFAEVLDRFNHELRQAKAGQQRRFVEGRLVAAEAEVADREDALRTFLQQNRQLAHSPDLQIAHDRLRRQLHLKEEVLTTVHHEYEQARLREVNDLPVLTVVDRAVVPAEPSSPAPLLIALLAFGGGVALALLVTLAQELRERARRREARTGDRGAGTADRDAGSLPPPSEARDRTAAGPRSLLRSSSFWAGVLLATPVFVSIGSGGIGLAPSYGEGAGALTVLPASALTIPAFIVLLLIAGGRTRVRFFPEDLLVGLYVALLTASALLGLMLNQSPAVPGASRVTVARLGQALFPLAGYFLARLVIRAGPAGGLPGAAHRASGRRAARRAARRGAKRASRDDLSAFLIGLSLTVLLALGGYIVQTGLGRASAFQFSVLADHIGPFYNYKMKRFFPSYVAVASVACLAFYLFSGSGRRARLLALAGSGAAAGALGLMWSRTAMLMWLMGFGMLLALAALTRRGEVARRVATIVLVLLVGASAGAFALQQLGAQSYPRLLRTAVVLASGLEEAGRGDVTRFERMQRGVRAGLGQPLGDMHRIHPAPQGQREGRDILESENGYLDFAVRAGPVALLAVLTLFLLGTARSVRLAWQSVVRRDRFSHPWAVFGFAAILVSVVLVGNFWLNLATEPYFAPLVWFMVGTALVLGRTDGSGESPDAVRAGLR